MREYSNASGRCQPARLAEVYGAAVRALAAAGRWLVPPACRLCLEPADGPAGLCRACTADLPWLGPACARCALPLPAAAATCGACSLRIPPFAAAFAAFRYDFPLDRLVHQLKFGGQLGHARLLGTLLAARAAGARVDAWVPVPLHRAREAARGYDQALEIAAFVAARHGAPLAPDWLWRTRATAAQSALGALERRRNVAGAFRADRAVAGRVVGLVDDVMTTGSTVEAATRALLAAGAARVEVWVVARAGAPRLSDRAGRARGR